MSTVKNSENGMESKTDPLKLNASVHKIVVGNGATACFSGIELKTKVHTIVTVDSEKVVKVSVDESTVDVDKPTVQSTSDPVHKKNRIAHNHEQ